MSFDGCVSSRTNWRRLIRRDGARGTVKSIALVVVLSTAVPVTSHAGDLDDARAAFKAGDYAKAAQLLTPLARDGDATAASVLGDLYLLKLGNPGEAFRWFVKSAEAGHPRGQYSLGWMYEKGLAVARDDSEAVKWYRKSAEQRYPLGQILLGTMYGSGRGVPQDYGEAMKWYRQAADHGDPDAYWRIGAMYAQGQGLARDYAQAEEWFRKAASRQNPHGQLWLGRLYVEGWGVGKDIGEAAKWYKLAVDQLRKEGKPPDVNPADRSVSAVLLRALMAAPDALALSYLAMTYNLKFAEVARSGSTFRTAIDGEWVTIDKSNADVYVGRFREGLDIVSSAFRQRGFPRFAKEYDTAVSQGCQRLGFTTGTTVIDQDEFTFRLTNGPFQGGLGHRGASAEFALAIEYSVNPEIHLVGHVSQGRIELKDASSDCRVTLTAKSLR
jgi:TPR repeat protein